MAPRFWIPALISILLSSIPFCYGQDFTCGPDKPCALGCCSNAGFCGLGPDFCGPATCISSCDQKSDCDPGWGSQWSSAETCPLNVCCSKFGFCGTTKDFCGDNVVSNPSCAASAHSSGARTVGYYEGWAPGRACDAMTPEKIPAAAYTHINFAFASIDPTAFTVATASAGDEDLYRRVTNLKTINRGLQVWISIGGWTFNDPDQPTAKTFSQLAASASAQQTFFASLVSFMSTYGFDGIDIDWEYPVAEERSGTPEDKANYVTLVANMRSYFQSTGDNYGISLTLPSSYWYLQHFDIVGLESHIDWFNMMSYDLHGTWDANSVYLGPKVAAHTNLTEIDQALKLLWRNNIDPKKVTLGLGFYGRSFALSDPSCTAPGCQFSGPAPPGPCTASAGTLSYGEIKDLIPTGQTTLDRVAAVQILTYGGNNWVSYDDATTIGLKVAYADASCLGGTMVWAVSTDSQDGELSSFLSPGQVANPSKFNVGIVVLSDSAPTSGQCRWINCGESCPSGFSPAALAGGGLAISDRQCPSGQTRSFCCPSDLVPTCHWSDSSLGGCNNQCDQGEVNVGSSTNGCWFGSKALCCENRLDTTAIGNCDWVGDSPFCSLPFTDASCPNTQVQLTSSSRGDGGESLCFSGEKSLCCNNPPPWKNCAWYYQQGFLNFINVLYCPGTCPLGKAVVSVDSSNWCGSGKAAYCCDPPDTIPASFPNAGLDGGSQTLTNLWNKWLQNPMCDSFGDNDPELTYSRRRALQALTQTSAKRDSTTPTTRDIALLFGPAIVQSLVGSISLTHLRNTWESLVAAAGPAYNGMSVFSLQQVLNSYPDLDPSTFLDWLLCAFTDASSSLGDLHTAQTELCTCQLGQSRRDLSSGDGDDDSRTINTDPELLSLWEDPANITIKDIHAIARRIFTQNTNPDYVPIPGQGSPAPGIARALSAITQNQLRFEYFNFFRFSAGAAGSQIGLEVAYLAGPDMLNLRADVRHLRDPTQSTGPRYDRFVILHYHFRSVLVNGVRMLGISQVNIRHGNQIRLTIQNGQLNAANAGFYRAQATQHIAAAVVLACDTGNAWCPINGPPTQNHNNNYAALIATTTTTSNFQQIFNAQAAPANFLPAGVDWINGNWPTNIHTSGFSFDSNGDWYNPIRLGYTTANGFLSTRQFSTVNPGEN